MRCGASDGSLLSRCLIERVSAQVALLRSFCRLLTACRILLRALTRELLAGSEAHAALLVDDSGALRVLRGAQRVLHRARAPTTTMASSDGQQVARVVLRLSRAHPLIRLQEVPAGAVGDDVDVTHDENVTDDDMEQDEGADEADQLVPHATVPPQLDEAVVRLARFAWRHFT